MYFLIVSGMSGAGKSRAVATLEDLGYYCVDNLPISLIPRFAEICLAATERYERVALVTDVRAGGDFQQLLDRKSTRLNSSHSGESRMPSSA